MPASIQLMAVPGPIARTVEDLRLALAAMSGHDPEGRRVGYEVEDVELPLLEEACRLWWLLAMEDSRLLMPRVEQVADDGTQSGGGRLLLGRAGVRAGRGRRGRRPGA